VQCRNFWNLIQCRRDEILLSTVQNDDGLQSNRSDVKTTNKRLRSNLLFQTVAKFIQAFNRYTIWAYLLQISGEMVTKGEEKEKIIGSY
jgi:hypothetical protein